jgi:hypothetical protein
MPSDPDTEAARAELHRAIMAAFCNVLHASKLPPMTVMSLAAGVVGSIYKEVADQHRYDDPCPCGWQPSPTLDVEVLQAALAEMTETDPLPDLRIVQVAGRA